MAVSLALGLASGILVYRAARTRVQRVAARANRTRESVGYVQAPSPLILSDCNGPDEGGCNGSDDESCRDPDTVLIPNLSIEDVCGSCALVCRGKGVCGCSDISGVLGPK